MNIRRISTVAIVMAAGLASSLGTLTLSAEEWSLPEPASFHARDVARSRSLPSSLAPEFRLARAVLLLRARLSRQAVGRQAADQVARATRE